MNNIPHDAINFNQPLINHWLCRELKNSHLIKPDDSLTNPCSDVCVVDEGDLLYHTSWNRKST